MQWQAGRQVSERAHSQRPKYRCCRKKLSPRSKAAERSQLESRCGGLLSLGIVPAGEVARGASRPPGC